MPTTLPILLDRSAEVPLYRQIEGALRAAIDDGRLPPGTPLPGIRTLAAALDVARITVATAYEQLTAEGYLEARVGSGTRVAQDAAPAPRLAPAPDLAIRRRATPKVPGTRALVDLRPAGIRVDDAPADTWEGLLRTAWRQLVDEAAMGGVAEPEGDRPLREAIAARVGQTRGIRCAPDEIVVTAGRRPALAVLADMTLGPGRVAAVEDPVDPAVARLLEATGARVASVPVDALGLRVPALPATAALARVTPSWQELAGGVLSMDRRYALLAWATTAGALLIEDDLGADIRYRGTPLPALRALDRGAGSVAYLGSLDHVLFDGLRVAFVIAPRAMARPLADRLELLGHGPGRLEQRALALFLSEGHADRHLRRLRRRLAERQDALVQAVTDLAPGVLRAAGAPAGRHLVLSVVDPRISARTLAARARAEGVQIDALATFRRLGGSDRDLVAGYTALRPEQLRDGILRIVTAAERATCDDSSPAEARRASRPEGPEAGTRRSAIDSLALATIRSSPVGQPAFGGARRSPRS